MREIGTIVAVDGERVRVRMQPGPRCGSCCACAAVGGERELELTTGESLEPGDRVAVEIATPNAALSAVLVFLLPLLGLVGGVLIGHHFRPLGLSGDADALVLGFGLLIVVLGGAAVFDRLVLRARIPEPHIVEVISRGAVAGGVDSPTRPTGPTRAVASP